MFSRVHVERVVGTCLRAGFTANAAATVEIDNAVLSREQCGDRTNLDTRSVGAMIAPHDRKQPSCIGKCSLFDVFYPGAIYADRHLVLGLAGDRAGVAADALSVVDYEAKIHYWITGLVRG